MNKTEINTLKKNIENKNKKPVQVREKGFLDLYDLVANKAIWPVYDEQNNIIGLNCLMSNPTGLQYSKLVGGQMTVGRTEKEREADEKALLKFSKEYGNKPLLRWYCNILQLIEAEIVPDRVDDIDGVLYYYIAKDRKVIDQYGNDVVKLPKTKSRVSTDEVVDQLADKLALALADISPDRNNATPKAKNEDAPGQSYDDESEENDSDNW